MDKRIQSIFQFLFCSRFLAGEQKYIVFFQPILNSNKVTVRYRLDRLINPNGKSIFRHDRFLNKSPITLPKNETLIMFGEHVVFKQVMKFPVSLTYQKHKRRLYVGDHKFHEKIFTTDAFIYAVGKETSRELEQLRLKKSMMFCLINEELYNQLCAQEEKPWYFEHIVDSTLVFCRTENWKI